MASRCTKSPAAKFPSSEVKQFVPKYVVRPVPVMNNHGTSSGIVQLLDGSVAKNYLSIRDIWLHVFQFLQPADITTCMQVCKTWYRWCLNRSLWCELNLSCRVLRQTHLLGIVYRQPTSLDLSWTNISRQQLDWLIARQPYLKILKLVGNSWAAVSALCSSSCPLLRQLILNWVDAIHDECIADLLLPPTDHRPGIDESISRLHRCTVLGLAGANITDTAISTIVCNLPCLQSLDLSCCIRLTDEALKILSSASHATKKSLVNLKMNGCHGLTNNCFLYMVLFVNLNFFDLSLAAKITSEAALHFVSVTCPKFSIICDRQFRVIEKNVND